MPLTELQRMVAQVLRGYRSASSFVGGGAALNRNWSRISDDLDIYTDGHSLPASARIEIDALRNAGYSVDVLVETDLTVDVIVRNCGSETRLQWMDDPETSKRFFAAIDDDEFGFRLHEADNAVNKVLCAAKRHGAPRDAADLMMIVEKYAPLGPLVWAVCGKDEDLTPPQVIRDIRKHAFGYADVEFETIRTNGDEPITREKVRSVLALALDAAATYCDVAPTEFTGWLFVNKDYIPVEASAEQLREKTAFALPLKRFRTTPQFIS